MKKSILAIFLVILAAHVVVIGYFMYRNRHPQPATTEPPAAEQAAVPSGATTAEPTPPGVALRPRSQTLGVPYNYQGATFGDIPGLFGGKLATAGIAVDLDSRRVLWAKNPRRAVPIASMTKMMTELLSLEDIETRPDVDYETMVQVTPTAMKIGGSQVYLDVREAFPIRDLLKTVMIVSANDSAYLLAEFLGGGDPSAFVRRMNTRAGELRLPGTKFYNPHGLPGENAATDNASTCEAMIMLAEQLLEYPDAVKWASSTIDTFREGTATPFQLRNHNRLAGSCPGVNGMKTGFIQRSGFCITVTCLRGGRRIACAVTGFPSRKERDDFVRRLLDWAYANAATSPLQPQTADPLDLDVIPK